MENLAVNMENFQRKNIARKFELPEHENYYPNDETIEAIEEVEKGIGLSRTFDTVDELMKDLSYQPNELTLKTIKEAELGINMHGPFDTVAEVMEALDAED